MTSFRIRRFKRPSLLKRIQPEVLRQFLYPHKRHLEKRGLKLDDPDIDCDCLGSILATPESDFPGELIEALEVCEAVSSHEIIEELIELDHKRSPRLLDKDHSPEDVVILTWLHDRPALERIANRAALELDRSLMVYKPSTKLKKGAFDAKNTEHLQTALRPFLEAQLRGPSCHITAYDRPKSGHALVIRHGDPIHKAEAIRDNGDGEPIVFRPECIDLAFYDPSRNEWRISGRATWQQNMYSSAFASVLHEKGCKLTRSPHYTLEPLMKVGLPVLDHLTVHVRGVRVTELNVNLSGANVRLSGRHLHEAFDSLATPLVDYGTPKSARFAFLLENRRNEFYVTINQGKAVVRGDIDDPAIEEWLSETGFMITEHNESESMESR